MSRSRRHFPACGITTARSEKEDKRIHNRRFRHRIKQALKPLTRKQMFYPLSEK
jgi:hypothetical protein